MNKKQFFRYLKERGVYKAWLSNLNIETKYKNNFMIIEKHGSIKKFIDFYIDSNQPEEIIMNSFGWTNTKEGAYFWSKIYNEIKTINDGEKNIEECCI